MAADPPRLQGLHLTARDRMLLSFVAEHRLVLERHLERLVGGGVRSRLWELVEAGYLSAGYVFAEPYHQIRRKGLAAIDSDLPVPRFNLAAYKHDVGVAWLWLAAHGGTFGPLREVLSERVLRSHDGALDRAPEPCGVRLGGLDRYGNERLHYPDLLLIDSHGRRLALELELTPKGCVRRELILGGYAADNRIDHVHYLVEANPRGHAIKRLLESTTRQMELAERVSVQLVKPILTEAGQPPQLAHQAVGRARSEACEATR
jgi:hypothetical protein